MPTVVRENVDELSAVLTVKLATDDYLPKLNAELKKYAQKAQIKGFRKGKTPESYVKKLYGQSVLLDIVNNEVKEGLSNYIRDEKLLLFGEPLINEKQVIYDFDVFHLEPMDFLFDVGLYPEVKLLGLDKETTYDYFVSNIIDIYLFIFIVPNIAWVVFKCTIKFPHCFVGNLCYFIFVSCSC